MNESTKPKQDPSIRENISKSIRRGKEKIFLNCGSEALKYMNFLKISQIFSLSKNR